jgi:hypothetical protein
MLNLSGNPTRLEKRLKKIKCLQPAPATRIPTVTDGIPGYNPTPGVGYHALRNGATVFVLKEDVSVAAPTTPLPSVPTFAAVTAKPALATRGPPVKGWSWKVSRNKVLSKPKPAILAPTQASTSADLLSNSFAALAVEHAPRPIRELPRHLMIPLVRRDMRETYETSLQSPAMSDELSPKPYYKDPLGEDYGDE